MTLRFLTLVTVFFSTLMLTADDRPNVLFIAVDDLNHWVSHLGRNSQAKTQTLIVLLPWAPPSPMHTRPSLPASLPGVP